MVEKDIKSQFWRSVLQAVETNPCDISAISGVSGFSHPVVALGIDEKRRRIVIISGESDARVAAMSYGDIQAAIPNLKLIMARPAAVNLGLAAQLLTRLIGSKSIGQEQIDWLNEHQSKIQSLLEESTVKIVLDKISYTTIRSFSIASLNVVSTIKEIIQQLSLIEIERSQFKEKEKVGLPAVSLSRLMALDPVEVDRLMGVCSIPLYDFSPEEIEEIHSGVKIDGVRDILKRRDILQYFFPPPDHLALGLAEQPNMQVENIIERLSKAPEIGHPYGEMEIFNTNMEISNIVGALQDRGLLVEGEIGFEVSNEGKTFRSLVRYKPREGLLARISRVFSIKVDVRFKDLFD